MLSPRKLRRKEAKKAPPTKKSGRGKEKESTKETKGRAGSGKVTRSARGKGRRSLAKKKPVKAAEEQPTVVTAKKVYFEGNYFQVGLLASQLPGRLVGWSFNQKLTSILVG